MNRETASTLGCSVFERAVVSPKETRVIKPATNNSKMTGKGSFPVIVRGRFKGMPMFKVCLEERRTCPKTCLHWNKCYGNNMPFAKRVDHTDPDFFNILRAEVLLLASIYKFGFVVRLHELGDFYSVEYAKLWLKILEETPNLRIIGFTANPQRSKIGAVIEKMNSNTRRCYIRFSGHLGDRGAVVDYIGKKAFMCPSNRLTCAQCTLCWETQKCVSFKSH